MICSQKYDDRLVSLALIDHQTTIMASHSEAL